MNSGPLKNHGVGDFRKAFESNFTPSIFSVLYSQGIPQSSVGFPRCVF